MHYRMYTTLHACMLDTTTCMWTSLYDPSPHVTYITEVLEGLWGE